MNKIYPTGQLAGYNKKLIKFCPDFNYNNALFIGIIRNERKGLFKIKEKIFLLSNPNYYIAVTFYKNNIVGVRQLTSTEAHNQILDYHKRLQMIFKKYLTFNTFEIFCLEIINRLFNTLTIQAEEDKIKNE